MSDLKPRTASVVIYQGDDLERLSDLRRAADIAQRHVDQAAEEARNVSARLGDDDADLAELKASAQAAKDAYDAAVDEAADRAVVIEVHALKRSVFRELMAKHPARKDNDEDALYGVSVDDFPAPFLAESVTKVAVGERELPQGQSRELIEDLPEGDFDRLFSTAYMLNRAPGADPREGRYSQPPRTSPEN